MKQQIRTRSTQLALAALVVLTAACGNRDDTTAPTGNGSIVLTLTSPDGSTPSVTVTGPNGYSHTVSGTTTLTHLAAGSYTITADSIVTQSTIVGYRVDTAAITGNPVTVTSSGASAATVTYAFARQHGALWVSSNSNSFLSGFARSQLLTSGVVVAADTIGNLPDTPPGLAFDANGNMWVATNGSDSLKMYTVAQRNTGSAIAAPARVLVSTSLSAPNGMNFDSHGNLWLADAANGLLQFSAAQLAAGGSVGAAAITIYDTLGKNPDGPGDYAVAFDASGNAWVGEDAYDNIVEYTVSQLTSSGSPTPHVRLGETSVGTRRIRDNGAVSASVAFGFIPVNINDPDAIAFDTHGNLWVANYYGENVSAYSPSQLATSGDPTPSVIINMAGSYPYGLAFDKNGGLWVADDYNYTLRSYTAAQLTSSGSLVPAVILTSGPDDSINDPQQIAFDEWVVPTTPPLVGTRTVKARSVAVRKTTAHKKGGRH